jgi:RNA polymerase sigma-70 factor (ECF subfamily)
MSLRLVRPTPDLEAERGSSDALDELYQEYAADVKRWAYRLAGPGEDLEDLLHDVFVVALRRRFTFCGQAKIRTWLFRITSNVVHNRRRRGIIRRLLFRRHQHEILAAAPAPATPQDEIERRERCARLYQALDRLPDCYRTTLILFEIERLSGEEVAELTGVGVDTVWVRLHRGRRRLLEHLTREDRG